MVYLGELDLRAIGSVGHTSWFTEGNDTGPDDANHDPMGVLISCGPKEKAPGPRQTMSILQVAPMILGWFGL